MTFTMDRYMTQDNKRSKIQNWFKARLVENIYAE
jgi:hypothetical protein